MAQSIRDRVQRVPVTPEWLAENQAKQAAYVEHRRAWREQWQKRYGRPDETDSPESPVNTSQSSESNTATSILALVFKNACTTF